MKEIFAERMKELARLEAQWKQGPGGGRAAPERAGAARSV
jgi:hypothetical protein